VAGSTSCRRVSATTTAIAVDADSGVAHVSDLSGQIWAVSLDGPEEYIVARVDGDLTDIAGASYRAPKSNGTQPEPPTSAAHLFGLGQRRAAIHHTAGRLSRFGVVARLPFGRLLPTAKGTVLKPRFGARGWGHERMGLSPDDGVFYLAAQAAHIALPPGLPPRATAATFFAGGEDAPGGDLRYVQHLQHFEWGTSERALLEKSIRALQFALHGALAADLEVANVMGIDVGDGEQSVVVNSLASAMQVPPPPQTQWSAVVVAVYVPNALNLVSIYWGVVKDAAACQYSTDELVVNSFRLIRNLWLTNVAQDNGE